MPIRAAPVARGSTDYAPLPVTSSSRQAADETQPAAEEARRTSSTGSESGTLRDDACPSSTEEPTLSRVSTAQFNPPPRWFDPAVGGPGRVISLLSRPCVRHMVRGGTVCGAVSFSSIFFLAASCDARNAPYMVHILAGVGVLTCEAGWLVGHHNLLAMVHWEQGDGENGVLQQLHKASDGNISNTQRERLRAWWWTCAALFVAILAFYALVGAACIELFVRQRNDSDSLSIVGGSLHAILPDPSCISSEVESILLGLLLCIFVPMGCPVAVLGAGLLLAVGLGAELAVDLIRDVRQVLDKTTWPWITKNESLATHLSASSDACDDDEAYERFGAAGRNRRAVVKLFRRIKRDGYEGLRRQEPIEGITADHVAQIQRLCNTADDGSAVSECVMKQVMKIVGYRLIMSSQMLLKDEPAFDAEVRRPIVLLASKILPLLSQYSGCISAFVLSFWSLSLAMLPLAAATHNVFCTLMVGFFPAPLLVLGPLAIVGTSCDDLLGDLNELRRHRLTDGACLEQACRVDTIRNYLKDMNHGQGVGFEFFGVGPKCTKSELLSTRLYVAKVFESYYFLYVYFDLTAERMHIQVVLDKRKLIRITCIMASGLTSVFVALKHFGEGEGNDSGSMLCAC